MNNCHVIVPVLGWSGPGEALVELAKLAERDAGVRVPLTSPRGMAPPREPYPDATWISVHLLADDRAELEASVQKFMAALAASGLTVGESAEVLGERPVEPIASDFPGVVYDEARKHLMIDATEQGLSDIEIAPIADESGYVFLMVAAMTEWGRLEESYPVRSLSIRRGGGQPGTWYPGS